MNTYMLDVLELGDRVAGCQALEDHIGTMESFWWRMPSEPKQKIRSIGVRDRQRAKR